MSKTPSQGSSVYLRNQRRKLCERQKWKCYWCGNQMVWIILNGKGTRPSNAATIDHLDDRWSPERGQHNGQRRRVAACLKCNEDRSNERTKGIYAEHQRAKSKEGHLKKDAEIERRYLHDKDSALREVEVEKMAVSTFKVRSA